MFKPVLAMIGGFMMASGMFAGGLLFAVFFLMPGDPQDAPTDVAVAADLWSGEPRRVNAASQDLERIPARPVTTPPAIAAVDPVNTGTVAPAPVAQEPANPEAARLLQAHAEWCAGRYRSYDAGDNSYSPYSGGRRACVSPYSDSHAALTGADAPTDAHVRFVPQPVPSESIIEAAAALEGEVPGYQQADARGEVIDEGFAIFDEAHVRDCFARYRSYRPQDNSYQPWGGGARRQCE